MHHIFVSYSRLDADWVLPLAAELERRGQDVWLDQQDIPVSVPWLREVQDAIEEAGVFLRCDSPNFRRSSACSAEVAMAEQVAKPQFVVNVGGDRAAAARAVHDTLGGISADRFRRTELRILARDWDRAGRPRNRLASPIQRRRLARSLMMPPRASEIETGFLKASRSRARRVSLVGTLVLSLILTSLVSIEAFSRARRLVNDSNNHLAAAFRSQRQGLADVARDPYLGLRDASRNGVDESAVHAAVITAALADPTPDDSFTGVDLRRFVLRPIGDDVVTVDAQGQQWHRGVSETGTRTSTALPTALVPSKQPAPHGLTAVTSTHSSLVEVHGPAGLLRTVLVDGQPGGWSFSPDGRFLAVAVGSTVDIVTVSSGAVRLRLRGATATLLDIAWTIDGTHVWALSSGRAFSWSTGRALTLVNTVGANFNSVVPAAEPQAVWIADGNRLTEISITSGTTLAQRSVDDTISNVGAAADGTVAVVSGEHRIWIVPLAGAGAVRSLTEPNCAAGRPTLSDPQTAYVPCIGGKILKISIPSGTVVDRIQVSAAGAYGSRAAPGTSRVYVGDRAGIVYVLDGTRVTRLFASECDVDISRVAVAPTEQAVLPVGGSSGYGTCTRVGIRGGGDPMIAGSWTWNVSMESQNLSMAATAVAFSRQGGSFAIGYSDGTVTVHPTANVSPVLAYQAADGTIRDMLMTSAGELIFVTDSGMVQRAEICDDCISNAALSRVAAARLRRAVELGLVAPTPATPPIAGPGK